MRLGKIFLGQMSKRLPSLTSLRAFEAAARKLSFAKAAAELSVTPAAVGFQIKQLESEICGALFVRKHRAIELTDKGRVLAAELGPAFRTIEGAWDGVFEPKETKVLKITGPAKAVHSWVLPALAEAKHIQPDVRLSWDLSKQIRDVSDGTVDLAIRWAKEPDGDLHWEPLVRTWFTPLVRADVARFIQRPEDLARHGLIGVEFELDAGRAETVWASWYLLQGLPIPRDFAVRCADTASAVETAIATGHVAMGGSFLAHEPLKRGDLVAPFDVAIAPFSRFWLVCRKRMERSAEFNWVLDAVREGSAGFEAASFGMSLRHPDGTEVQN